MTTPANITDQPEAAVGREWPGVAEQFTAWCARTPRAVAVEQDDRRWTYRDLEEKATAVAGLLARAGARPGTVVAVAGPKNVALVAAWLAALSLRCVLLPLDPAQPDRARDGLLARAGARLLITTGAHPGRCGKAPVLHLHLDDGPARPGGRLTGRPDPAPGDGGYVFFTSGSTGTPKAILGRHASLAHFLTWLRTTLNTGPGDRIPHLAGPGFDVALREVLLPLTCGATLLLPPPLLPPARVPGWLADHRATVVHTVPTVARAWLRAAPPGIRLPTLRALLFSGEPLTGTLTERWRDQLGHQGLVVNQYGPTETTLIRCWHPVPDSPPPGIVPLGRPIPGSEVWTETSPGVRAPAGTAGEIVIRTLHGTSGYLGNPAETAARFVFGPGHLVTYRTGDLGVLDAGGVLHFHGRFDDQIKIHGVRFHLSGVEAALEAQPGVDHAAVTAAPGDDGGPPRLTARLVLAPGHHQVPAGLRSALLDQLPAAAIPGELLVVDALPRLPASGKLDRTRTTT